MSQEINSVHIGFLKVEPEPVWIPALGKSVSLSLFSSRKILEESLKILSLVLIIGIFVCWIPAGSAAVTPSRTLGHKIEKETQMLTLSHSHVNNGQSQGQIDLNDLGESSEDGQYYDDDAGVTFVTDEDLFYDDARTPPPNQHQHHNPNSFSAHSIPVQFQIHSSLQQQIQQQGSLGVGWDDSRCPPFPDIPSSSQSHRALCHGRRCSRDSDCSSHADGSLICCYNGCIHSCQHKLDPPLAFDWLEETELMSWRNNGTLEEEIEDNDNGDGPGRRSTTSTSSTTPRGSLSKKTLLGVEVTPETIALPGGCFLNPIQYEHLRLFKKHEHVQSCTCSQGDVLCHVNLEKDRIPSSTKNPANPAITLSAAGS